jgi:molybdopterin biosynthesis enzyme MoaB
MVGELVGTVHQLDERMVAHDARMNKIIEDHETRIKANETFRTRVKATCATVISIGGTGLGAWWKAHGF